MNFKNKSAETFVPDGWGVEQAIARVTHWGIGAHQDDLEFMAFHGILECHGTNEKWFGGVTCTNGAGSSRTGKYAGYTDAQMMAVRRHEQNAAAVVGQYAVMVQLDHPSSVVKSATDKSLKDDLKQILAATRPQVIYTHNPADKHDTHVGVAVAVIEALRELPASQHPDKLIGCEVWRDLDWMVDGEKILLDMSGHDHLAAALNGIFDSQIAGGKRYDLATLGRRSANATFFESHQTDRATQVNWGMDLTPLVKDKNLDIVAYTCGFIERFQTEVKELLNRRLGKI
jgi:LmbE family N-acetylglucosaminyl deacetylase